jgi:hypothetical protein
MRRYFSTQPHAQASRPLRRLSDGRKGEANIFSTSRDAVIYARGAMISMRRAPNLGGITIWQMAACFGFNPRHHHRRHRQPSKAFAYIKNKLCSYSVE